MARLIPSPTVGHHSSDEISALLAAARARHYGEFRASFTEFGVPGQNQLCAGNRGTSSRFSLRPSRRGRRRAITTICAIPRTRALTRRGSSGRLDTWDGDYRPDSAAAATLETLLYYLASLYTDGRRQASALLGQWGFLTKYLIPDLEALSPTRRARLFRQVLRKTARRAGRYAVWGDMHRLGAAHWLGGLPYHRMRRISPGAGSRQALAGRFSVHIDQTRMERHADYREYRRNDVQLDAPRIILVDPGTLASWLRTRGRLGGQNKVLRVIND
ncbi:penicillin acylase family protein [Acidithiobacillus sp.]|uniref:penicillin acylase family protein n=1 Tax=Acidithiobacillus sp. TaxID=1872118 RepID=UPI00258885E9|nr:penicillin acylase family protein [Acidithiobacillus sp.]MDD5375006.1 penicillin acylase family protein [Acidithiobacillus sp.]